MKKLIALILVASALLTLTLTGCKSDGGERIVIAVPNDTTNEARALLILEAQGIIKLREGAGLTATVRDIVSNPLNIEFREVEAAQLPTILPDVDYAVINSNYAIDAGLNPTKESLITEGAYSAYANILACREGEENTDKIKALKAALSAQIVVDYIGENFGGAVVSVINEPHDGKDPSVNYAALAGTTIKVAASPAPHAELLEHAAAILATENITLEIVEFTDYVQPNLVVDSGELDANFFQHLPYLEDFNREQGTKLVSVIAVHVEPMCLYGGRQSDLSALGITEE